MIATIRRIALPWPCSGGAARGRGHAPGAAAPPSPSAVAADERPVILAWARASPPASGWTTPTRRGRAACRSAWTGRPPLPRGERRGERRDVGGRAEPAGLAAPAEGGRLRPGDRSERRPARPGPGVDPGQHRRHPDARRGPYRRRPGSSWWAWRRRRTSGASSWRLFRAMYPDLAGEHGAALVPFLLEGVAGVPALNQPDGVHPTAEGHAGSPTPCGPRWARS